MKHEYLEFKICMCDLIEKTLKVPKDRWMMSKGMPWSRYKKRD
uniref:Uncharacterized protein n=2 Tax=Physcomitrium patens TaxID=3218 RepID=A0A7I3ZXN2_PHYPA